MASADAILTRLLTSLSLSDPTWDTSVGSATYKIMESVAQELANTSNNSTLLTYGYDVNSKFGTELDAFVNLFGVNRQLGTRSTGTVTFSTNSTASQNYDIPLGTQVYASSSNFVGKIAFTTTSPAIITSGQISAIVPVICTLPGTFGNLPANSINQIGTPLVGVTYVINEYDLVNGTDTETDDQLKKRFFNTAFSNFAGTVDKFTTTALQNPNVERVSIIGAQQRYTENLQINTTISGNSTFNVALNTQAKLSVASGATVASGVSGSLKPYITIPVSGTDGGLGSFSGTVLYDGSTYTLSTATTGSGYLLINYTVSGTTPTTLSGTSTGADLVTAISGLLNGTTLNYVNSIAVLSSPVTSGFNTVSSGINISFSQGIPWNVVISSGTSVTAVNNIISQIPDSKYCYPQGNELVGLNIGTNNQILLSNINDYNYIRPSGNVPLKLKINFLPNNVNAPYTFTGQNIQLESEYIPSCSRIIVSGSGTILVNPNYVDVYIDGQTTQSVTEQVIFINSNQFTASGTGGSYDASYWLTASGALPTTNDYYVNVTQGPVANFPSQLISGTDSPTNIQFGRYSFPLVLNPTTTGITLPASGGTASNVLYTTNSGFANLQVGMVISGTSGTPTISGIGAGTYITSLVPGNPNQIKLNNNLTTGVSGSTTWVTVAYPVYDNTVTAGSVQDLTGVGFRTTDPTGDYGSYWPPNTNYSSGSLAHSYYSDVVVVDNLEQQSRTVGVNLLTHEAYYRPFIVNISIIYDSSISPDITNNSIVNNINQYFQQIGFGEVLNLNSLVQAIYSANGVWAAHITTSSESSTSYGLQEVTIGGSTKPGFYTQNIILNANQLPSLYKVNFFQFGQNNF